MIYDAADHVFSHRRHEYDALAGPGHHRRATRDHPVLDQGHGFTLIGVLPTTSIGHGLGDQLLKIEDHSLTTRILPDLAIHARHDPFIADKFSPVMRDYQEGTGWKEAGAAF